MGAVIDSNAFQKINDYIAVGAEEGRVALGGEAGDGADGYFIPPTIVADVSENSRLAKEEIFGPVLAFVKARDFEHAEQIFNDTEYGLTGGLFTGSRERDRARQAHLPRRQPVPQPQDHRRAGGRAAVRRLQHERHRLQSGRPGLLAAVHAGQVDYGAAVSRPTNQRTNHRGQYRRS